MRKMMTIVAAVMAMGSGAVFADTVDERLSAYSAEGAGPFDAKRGEVMWTQTFTHEKSVKPASCATCHTANVKDPGKHAKTGKPIEPLAPSVNPKRLTDVKTIEKWFTRNCKWTLGRECSPQEKGDFLSYLRTQ